MLLAMGGRELRPTGRIHPWHAQLAPIADYVFVQFELMLPAKMTCRSAVLPMPGLCIV